MTRVVFMVLVFWPMFLFGLWSEAVGVITTDCGRWLTNTAEGWSIKVNKWPPSD